MTDQLETDIGYLGALGTIDEVTWGTGLTVTQMFDYISENMASRGTILERDGVRGTRSRNSEDTRTGNRAVSGTVVFEPTPAELSMWLTRILGGTVSATVWPVAETLGSFTMTIDRVNKVFTYVGCKIAKATFTGSEGGIMRMALDIVAKDETIGNAASFPAITGTLGNTAPFIFSDSVLTLQSAARKVKSWEVVIDNMLDASRFMNSTTITDLQPTGRMVTFKASVPFASANVDLFNQALAGATGTLVLTTEASSVLTFTFGTLQIPRTSPQVPSKTAEGMLDLNMIARTLSTTKEITITNVP